MKHFIMIFALAFITSHLYAQKSSVMAGLNFSIFPQWSGVSFDTASGIPVRMDGETRGFMRIGGFADFRYLRFDIGYSMSLGNTAYIDYTYSTNAVVVLSNSNNQSFITFGVLAKYPFAVNKKISIWPAAGLEYQFCLFSMENNTNSLTNFHDNRNDLFLKIGCGADIELFQHVYFVPSLLFALDLFPYPYLDTINDPISVTHSFSDVRAGAYSWKMELNIGIAVEI